MRSEYHTKRYNKLFTFLTTEKQIKSLRKVAKAKNQSLSELLRELIDNVCSSTT